MKVSDRQRGVARDWFRRSVQVPPSIRGELVLGEGVEHDSRVFELYIPGAMPADAILLATVTVDREFAITDARVDQAAIAEAAKRAADGQRADPDPDGFR